jgi:hypothetical protein
VAVGSFPREIVTGQEALGIVPVFWKDEGKDEGPAVLPMVRPG